MSRTILPLLATLTFAHLAIADTALACCCKNEHDFSFYARQSTSVYLGDFIGEKMVKSAKGRESHTTVRPTEFLMGEKLSRDNRIITEDLSANCISDFKPGAKMLVFEKNGKYLAIGDNTSTVQLHKFVGKGNKQKNLKPIEDKLAEIYFQKIEKLMEQKNYTSARKLLTGWTVNNRGGESLRLAYLAELEFAQMKTPEGDEYLEASTSLDRMHPHQIFLNLARGIDNKEQNTAERATHFAEAVACNETVRALYQRRLATLKPIKEGDLDKAKMALRRTDIPVFYDENADFKLAKAVSLTLPRGVWTVHIDQDSLSETNKAAGEWSGEFLNVLRQTLQGASLIAHIEGAAIAPDAKLPVNAPISGADGDPIVNTRANPVEISCTENAATESWQGNSVGRIYTASTSMIDEINLRIKKADVCRKNINYCTLDSKNIAAVGSGKEGSEFKATFDITYGDYSDEATMYFAEKKIKDEFIIVVTTQRRSASGLGAVLTSGIKSAL